MSVELMTSWGEHDSALRSVLSKLNRSLRIFDEDLAQLKLENPATEEIFQRFLAADMNNHIQIIVRNAHYLQTRCARLMKLYTQYPGRMSVIQAPEHLAKFDDSLVIVDDEHAVIRFHQDHARSKLILDDSASCRPYIQRFKDILLEGGDMVTVRPLGL